MVQMAENAPTAEQIDAAGKFAAGVASVHGWVLNPDSEHTGRVVSGLAMNKARYGYFQCPCREAWGDREHDRDVICPCDYAAKDIEEYGHCFCGLFLAPTDTIGSITVDPIPERRSPERWA